jgi:MFS superfamily sulfate permease-like transporter
VSLKEDHVKLDRELLAHGVSNMAAGFLGTVSVISESFDARVCT